MYTVEDDLFVQARAIISSLARELDAQHASGSPQPVDVHALIRQAAAGLVSGGEAAYLHAIADRLERSFPISELFPRRPRTRSS